MTPHRRYQELRAINHAIARADGYDEILALVVERSAAFTGASVGLLLLAGPDGVARVVQSVGVEPARLAHLTCRLDEHLETTLRGALALEPSDTFVGAPVSGREGRSGVLAMFHTPAGDPPDEEHLAALADQAAIALDNDARLRRVRETEARTRAILTSMAEGVVVQVPSGAIVSCNPAAEHILGLSAAQLGGRTSVDPRWRAIREDGSPLAGAEHPAMAALRTGEPVSKAVMGIHKPEGTLTWLSASSEPLRLAPDAGPHAVVTTFSDITERRQVEAALRDAQPASTR